MVVKLVVMREGAGVTVVVDEGLVALKRVVLRVESVLRALSTAAEATVCSLW